jgi:hypothetical protein
MLGMRVRIWMLAGACSLSWRVDLFLDISYRSKDIFCWAGGFGEQAFSIQLKGVELNPRR